MHNIFAGAISSQQAIAGNAPVNTAVPTLTDAQTDGASQTLDPGEWTGAASFKIDYYVDGSIASGGTYLINSGDAAPTRNYDYENEVGRFRFIRVTAYAGAGQTGVASSPVDSLVRIGQPSFIVPSGWIGQTDDTALIDLVVDPVYQILQDSTGNPYTTAPWNRAARVFDDQAKLVNSYSSSRTIVREMDGIIKSLKFKVPLDDFASLSIPNGQSAASIRLCWVSAAGQDANWKTSGVQFQLVKLAGGWRASMSAIVNGADVLGSTLSHDTSNFSETWGNNTEFEIYREIEDDDVYYDIYVNGVRINQNFSSNPMRKGPIDSSNPKLNDNQNMFAMMPVWQAGSFATPEPFMTSLDFEVLPADYVTVSLGTVIQSPDDLGKVRIPFNGDASAGVEDVEIAVLLTDGTLISNWGDPIAVTGGVYSGSIDLPLIDGETFRIYARSASDPTISNSSEGEALVIPTVLPKMIGVNIGNMLDGEMMNNLFSTWGIVDMANVYTDPGNNTSAWDDLGFKINEIGFPTQIPNGKTYVQLRNNYWWAADPDSEIYGEYAIECHPDLQWNVVTNSVVSAVPGEPNKINVSNVHAGTESHAWIRITAFPADPEDCYIRAYKIGMSEATKELVFRPQATSYYSNFTHLRNMNMKGTNRFFSDGKLNIITPEMLAFDETFTVRGKPFAIGQMLKVARQTDSVPWDCLHDMMGGPAIRAYAQYIKDNLFPGETLWIERSNELWNSGFAQFKHNIRSAPVITNCNYQLVEGDYIKGAVTGHVWEVAYHKILSGSVGGGDGSGYILIASDMAFENTYGDATFAVNEDIHHCDAAGNVLHSNIGKNPGTVNNGYINYVRWLHWTIDQFEMVWGETLDPATSPVKFVCSWSTHFGGSNNTVYAAMLNEQNLKARISYFATAPYGLNAGDYLDTTSMSKINRDKALSDPAGYKTALAATLLAKGTASAEWFRDENIWLAQFCKDSGLSKDAIRFIPYECAPQHDLEANTPWMQFTDGYLANTGILNGGNLPAGGGNYGLIGKTSGARYRLAMIGNAANVESGSFASGNAVGWLTKGNKWTGDFTIGESCKLVQYRSNPVDDVLVQDDFCVVASKNDIQNATINAKWEFWRSDEWGEVYKQYLDILTTYGGPTLIFDGSGRGFFWDFTYWGYWFISEYVEDQTQQPYKAIQEWIGEN